MKRPGMIPRPFRVSIDIMNQIKEPYPPGSSPYDAGLNFDYAVWSADSVITLCNVPWDALYKDVVRFASRSALNTYLNNLPSPRVQISNVNYARINEPIRLNIPLNSLLRYNYVRVSNPLQPGTSGDVQRDYYYFITSARHVNPSVTEVIVQLDVMQTFMYDITVNSAFVERGHIGIANTNAFNNYGRDHLTVPEGLDLGSDYRIIAQNHETIVDTSDYMNDCSVLMVINTRVKTSDDDPYEYVDTEGKPSLEAANGSGFERLASGASVWYFPNTNDFMTWMLSMRQYPHVTQGIMSLTAIPNVKRYYPDFDESDYEDGYPWGVPQLRVPQVRTYSLGNSFRDVFRNALPTRYRHLTKFLTAPYSMLTLTTWTGNPVACKPEQWTSDNASVEERATLTPPGQRIVINPANYNGGEGVAMGVQIGNFPSLAIVNDQAIAYLQSNFNSINFQYQNAEYAAGKSLTGNNVSYANTQTGIQTSERQALAGAGLNMISGGAGLVAGGAGGVGGAASGLMNAGGNILQTKIANEGTQTIADLNKAFADDYAQGDYEQTVMAINARLQDAQLLQPSTVGNMGGETFNWANNMYRATLQFRMIDPARIAMIGDYWLRYGYAVHRYISNIPANLMAMSDFTYWKMREAYVTGNAPEEMKAVIRAVLEKGVTMWANANDIGKIDMATNAPLGGISY